MCDMRPVGYVARMDPEPSGESCAVRVRSPDGTVVGCEVEGAGPPLLLVHGSTADRNPLGGGAVRARGAVHVVADGPSGAGAESRGGGLRCGVRARLRG